MLTLSPDPIVAERQIEAIVFYLTTCGFVDSEFDLREKAFVRAYLRKLVTARVDAQTEISPEMRFEEIERQHEHYVERFREIETEVAELLSEATSEDEDPKAFVRTRLQLRCFELFTDLSEDNRGALLQAVDDFIHADGVVHPEELQFRNELAALLDREILVDEEEIVAEAIEIERPADVPSNPTDHPFFRHFEHHYSADPQRIQGQIDADVKVLDQAEAKLEDQRAAGAGRLVGKKQVHELEGAPFLDGHVYVVPNRDRDFEIIVLGDLHGCYSCLKAAVLQSEFMDKLKRHRAAPDEQPEVKMVLLGDYIDRGRFSYNGVLRTVLKLFLAAPDDVYVLRGNHEYYVEHEGRVYGGVRPADAIESLSGLVPTEVFARYLHFFEKMPNTLLYDQLLFVHAGIPRDTLLRERWQDLSSLNDPDIRFQMLWSDPSRADVVPDELQKASARFPFGRRQFRNFMAKLGTTVLVRGHEKINAGFRDTYADDDIKLLTLFSAGGAANEDIPPDSNYRDVKPMALTIRRKAGRTTITPWAIDYRSYQGPDRNAFFRSALEIDVQH